jgi:4a-hydroxytetrahydrobiopterin dehydratase
MALAISRGFETALTKRELLNQGFSMKPSLIPSDFDFQKNLPLWGLDESKAVIHREFVFTDFQEAFRFMTLCAQYAEELDHHPDWSNSWNKVTVHLTTHSSKGLTALDIQMAKAMDTFAIEVMC